MFVARFLVTTERVGGECDTRWPGYGKLKFGSHHIFV